MRKVFAWTILILIFVWLLDLFGCLPDRSDKSYDVIPEYPAVPKGVKPSWDTARQGKQPELKYKTKWIDVDHQ